MPPRGFTNPAPKTDSARSALTSFHCTLCNKSYSRHPEYEAHISSYDHQHKKRLRDLKQLSRDPNAAEKARKAERKADAEAGLVVVDSASGGSGSGVGTGAAAAAASGGGGGFKKGGFKSSFAVVGGSGGSNGAAGSSTGTSSLLKKNVLGDDEDDENGDSAEVQTQPRPRDQSGETKPSEDAESDTDEEYGGDDLSAGGGYYNPRRPTECFAECAGAKTLAVG